MAAFPLSQEPSLRTRITPDSGKRIFRTMGGGIRGRNSFDQNYFKLIMIDEFLNESEVTSIMGHHDTSPNGWHTRTIDGESYTFQYINRPRTIEYHGVLRTIQSTALGYI
jgi:hypothetical protein